MSKFLRLHVLRAERVTRSVAGSQGPPGGGLEMRQGGRQGLELAESRVSPERPGQLLGSSERGVGGDMIWNTSEKPLCTLYPPAGRRKPGRRRRFLGQTGSRGVPNPGNSRA